LNTSGAGRDYLAVYDHDSVRKEVIQLRGFTDSRKYSSHGFDLVPDEKNPKTLWLYAINHRKPLTGDAKKVGADSVVEIFKGSTTSYIFQYERTVKSQHLITPNDIIGSSDGKSFHWTNDYGTRTGLVSNAVDLVAIHSYVSLVASC
jgi:arylesterase / paraoxonase